MYKDNHFKRLKERELSNLLREIEGDTNRLIEAIINNQEDSELCQLGETMNGNQFLKLKKLLKGSAFKQIKLSLEQHREREAKEKTSKQKERRQNKERQILEQANQKLQSSNKDLLIVNKNLSKTLKNISKVNANLSQQLREMEKANKKMSKLLKEKQNQMGNFKLRLGKDKDTQAQAQKNREFEVQQVGGGKRYAKGQIKWKDEQRNSPMRNRSEIYIIEGSQQREETQKEEQDLIGLIQMNQINERQEFQKVKLLQQANRQKEETIEQMRLLIQEKDEKIEELRTEIQTAERYTKQKEQIIRKLTEKSQRRLQDKLYSIEKMQALLKEREENLLPQERLLREKAQASQTLAHQREEAITEKEKILKEKERCLMQKIVKFEKQTITSIHLRFSEELKGSCMAISSPTKANMILSSQQRAMLLEPHLRTDSIVKKWKVKIQKLVSWIGVGVAHIDSIKKVKFQFMFNEKNHGNYLVSSNGYCWNGYKKEFNGKRQTFEYTTGDIIEVTYDPPNNKVSFKLQGSESVFTYDVDPSQMPIHAIINLQGVGDAVEIIN